MFGLFSKKSELDRLREKQADLLKQAYVLSKSDRSAADRKTAEAAELDAQIAELSAREKSKAEQS